MQASNRRHKRRSRWWYEIFDWIGSESRGSVYFLSTQMKEAKRRGLWVWYGFLSTSVQLARYIAVQCEQNGERLKTILEICVYLSSFCLYACKVLVLIQTSTLYE
jgi:hypothetical protein